MALLESPETSNQQGEDDMHGPMPSSYRPSFSTGFYGSYVMLTTQDTSQQGEDDEYDPMPTSYQPSFSTGIYGSYAMLEPPKCSVCQHRIGQFDQMVSLDCCGIQFHSRCFNDLLKNKQIKPGHRMNLNKLGCIHCRNKMKCTQSEYEELLSILNIAYDKLRHTALGQLEKDDKFQDPELREEKSEYYDRPVEYAMDLYEFRSCYHCRDPYHAGYNACDSCQDEDDSKEMHSHCCSRKCAFEVGKLFYKERGPLIRDVSNVLSDIKENASNYKNVALPLNLGRDKPFSEWNEDQFKQEFSRKFDIPIDCIRILSVKAGSQLIEMKLESHRDGTELLLPIECIADRISGDEAKKAFTEFCIFAMEFGAVQPGFKLSKQRVIMNPKWNREYGDCPGQTKWTGALSDGRSRGNEPYYCPLGWKRFAIQFKVTPYDFDNVYDNWPIAYHGTKFDFSMMIVLSGLKCSARRACHGTGVYLSPSIKYVSHPTYAEPIKLDLSKARQQSWTQDQINEFKKYDKKWIQCAFMCRVKPGCYRKCRETMGLGTSGTFDNIDKSEIEWVVDGKADEIIEDDKILIYGIMIRASTNEPTGYSNYDANSIYEAPQNNNANDTGGCIVK